jgi:hypothetical protein
MTVDWRNWLPRPGIATRLGPLSDAEYGRLKARIMEYRLGLVPNRLHGAFIKEDGDAA